MKWAIIIIVTFVAICWIGSVVEYIFESRSRRFANSFQSTHAERWIFPAVQWLGVPLSFILSTIAVVLIAPIYIIEWLVNKPPRRKV
jgi:hypothetical protein